MLDEIQERREERFEKDISEGIQLLMAGKLIEGEEKMIKCFDKYFNHVENIYWKSLILRNLSKVEWYLGKPKESKKYCRLLYKTILRNEKKNMKEYPSEYIKALTEYTETFKKEISSKKLININQKIKKCAKDNDLTLGYFISEINIYFLKRKYNNVIKLLRKIHNEKLIQNNEEEIIANEIIDEFKDLKKYDYIEEINKIENNLTVIKM